MTTKEGLRDDQRGTTVRDVVLLLVESQGLQVGGRQFRR